MSSVNNYKDLLVWQKGIKIAKQCYFLTQNFPREELYGMTSQIRRSATSISANIAEGYGRRSTQEYIRFANIAQGSVNELETHLIVAKEVGLCKKEDIEPILKEIIEVTRMIIALIKSLEKHLNNKR